MYTTKKILKKRRYHGFSHRLCKNTDLSKAVCNRTRIRTLVGPGHEWNAWTHEYMCLWVVIRGQVPVWLVQRILSVQVGLDREKILFVPSRLEFSRRKVAICSPPLAYLKSPQLPCSSEHGRQKEIGWWNMSLLSPARHANRPRSPWAAETATEPSALTNQRPRVRTSHGTCSPWNAVRSLGILGKRQAS